MPRDKKAMGSRKALSAAEVREALKQASITDLLNEISQRGRITTATQADTHVPVARSQQPRQGPPGRQVPDDIDAQIEAARARTAKHYEYIGQLFELLRQEQMGKLRALGVQRKDTTPEFANLGRLMAKSIFDHLVAANREFLDAGACDIISVWRYLTDDRGYAFASGMVKGDSNMPPNLGRSFIHQAVHDAVSALLDVVEEDEDDG